MRNSMQRDRANLQDASHLSGRAVRHLMEQVPRAAAAQGRAAAAPRRRLEGLQGEVPVQQERGARAHQGRPPVAVPQQAPHAPYDEQRRGRRQQVVQQPVGQRYGLAHARQIQHHIIALAQYECSLAAQHYDCLGCRPPAATRQPPAGRVGVGVARWACVLDSATGNDHAGRWVAEQPPSPLLRWRPHQELDSIKASLHRNAGTAAGSGLSCSCTARPIAQ